MGWVGGWSKHLLIQRADSEGKQAEAEVVPSSSLVEVEVEVVQVIKGGFRLVRVESYIFPKFPKELKAFPNMEMLDQKTLLTFWNLF